MKEMEVQYMDENGKKLDFYHLKGVMDFVDKTAQKN